MFAHPIPRIFHSVLNQEARVPVIELALELLKGALRGPKGEEGAPRHTRSNLRARYSSLKGKKA